MSLCVPGGAAAASGLKIVSYHGYTLRVPRSWPVYDLAKDPSVCVRFNRHAVYLGRPGATPQCPAHAAGRPEALLLQPLSARAASAATAALPSVGSLLDRAHGLLVAASWNRSPALIERALGLRSLAALRVRRSRAPMAAHERARVASVAGALPGGVYTGSGFDVCSTPSASQMSAWGASRYHAIGVYIGGVNMACAQPNLSAGWVSGESAAGWHLVPIYVGLQAPGNSCGCAAISPSNASSQGTAAAVDAVIQAESLGMGPGNPLYFDMEGYARSGSTSSAVMTFLAAWTTQLHADGYKAGVYSSDDSGISDLVSEWGTGYTEPDEIWIANWNGAQSTSDPNVPAADWSNHQRLHQYEGGHDETHGRVTLNIDGDYLDAATAAAGSAVSPAAEPAASAAPTISGTPSPGQTLTEVHGTWPGTPTSYSYQWEDCSSTGYSCAAIPGASSQTYSVAASDIGHAIRVIETGAYPGGPGIPAVSQATAQVMSPVPLYWLYTAHGNIYPGPGTSWYRSPAAGGFRRSSVAGMAATADGKGYWVVGSGGRVWAYGDAAQNPAQRRPHPIIGIVASPGGGFWLYTAYGNVWGSSGTAWYGSPYASGLRRASITGMASTADGRGYWLVNAAGRVFAFGDATGYPTPRHAHPIKGIVAAPGAGYWLYTSHGNVYSSPGTAWFRSPAANGFRGSSIAGMAVTPDAKGYWLVSSRDTVFAYGDAEGLPPPPNAHPIIGLAAG